MGGTISLDRLFALRREAPIVFFELARFASAIEAMETQRLIQAMAAAFGSMDEHDRRQYFHQLRRAARGVSEGQYAQWSAALGRELRNARDNG